MAQTIKIEDINNAFIAEEASRLGATEAELVGRYHHPHRAAWIELYILNTRVFLRSYNDPVFEGRDPKGFAALVSEYEIDPKEKS